MRPALTPHSLHRKPRTKNQIVVPLALEILYEDNHLLAVNKPAGLATMGVPGGEPSLLTLAKGDIKRRHHKPGNVYLGTVSRLDAPVSGVVLFARTSKAAARLSEQFREREVGKTYWAVVAGLIPPSGELVDWLAEDARHRRMHTVEPGQRGARRAVLRYRRLEQVRDGWLVEVSPVTGRKHQIRLQLAAHGYPIVGDRKYGSRRVFTSGIALHARRLEVRHPVRDEPVVLEAPLPASWRVFGLSGQ